MAPAVAVLPEHGRLAHVMQQCRPPQRQLRRYGGGDRRNMGEKIVAVVGRMLVKVQRRPQLRNRRRHNPPEPEQILPSRRGQQAAHLLKNPFPGQRVQQRGQTLHGRHGGHVRRQGKPGRKPGAPQNPQGVLPEAGLRVPHRPQNAPAQVLPAAEGVGKAPGGGISHGVDGKVPPGQILPQVGDEPDPVRVPVVPVAPFPAEGGDLHHAVAGDHAHGAVLFPGQHQLPVRKHRLRLGRQRRGTQIVVMGRQPQHRIPDASAYGVAGKARRLQRVHAPGHVGGKLHDAAPSSGG